MKWNSTSREFSSRNILLLILHLCGHNNCETCHYWFGSTSTTKISIQYEMIVEFERNALLICKIRRRRQINIHSAYVLLCALSVGSLRRTTRLCAAVAEPESTSWMTILMASASTDAWRRGAASKSSRAGVGRGVPIVRNPPMSGLEQWLLFRTLLLLPVAEHSRHSNQNNRESITFSWQKYNTSVFKRILTDFNYFFS